jgi:adenylate kinase family enzyme
VYESETAPLLHFYTERGLLVTVDGDKEPGTVADDIVRFVSRGCVRKD